MSDFAQHYSPVIWVTLAYFLVYYGFMVNLLRVKLRVAKECKARGERFLRYSNTYPELLAADRVQLNTLEHMPPFLAILWILAAVTRPEEAAFWGWLYVALRALYPLFLGRTLRSNIPYRLLLNTFSAYGILAVMMVLTVNAIL